MGWRETIISDRDIAQYIGDHLEELIAQTEHGQHYPERWGREHQAEVSYKAGEEAGYQRALRHFDIIKASEETPEEVV